VNQASVTAARLRVFGRSGGPMAGSSAWSNGGQTLTFTPQRPFFPGELVTVSLSRSIAAVDATTLRAGGYTLQYLTAAAPAPLQLTTIDTVPVRTTGAGTRLYGGNFVDLDRDQWIDYVAVNEVSADLRVLLNRADGSGLLRPVLLPVTPIGQEASPNVAADFNGDGLLDMATSNTSSSSVSIVLGNGNGSFQPQQQVTVGSSPHGLVLVDVDGDADFDLVSASEGGNDLRILTNNNLGVFAVTSTFNSGGDGEYPLQAGDMNGDGLLDLVVGTMYDQRIRILANMGNGTFQQSSSTAAGGRVWKIGLGDLDGDGALDVAGANGVTNNGAILLGNGDGTLQAAVTHDFSGTAIASDLADLDGDGDLDWVVSSYTGSRWHVLTNNGAGTLAPLREIMAPSNASCASLYDFDNDGDIDLALADEVADVVLLVRNGAGGLFGNGFE
jgi:hypothetical protein